MVLLQRQAGIPSNPPVNNVWQAGKELHPTFRLWRPVPRSEDQPKIGGSVTTRTPAACAAPRVFKARCQPT